MVKKSIQKPQVYELTRVYPETSTKLYVHGFRLLVTPIFKFVGKKDLTYVSAAKYLFKELRSTEGRRGGLARPQSTYG
jgi:hypothetical protein